MNGKATQDASAVKRALAALRDMEAKLSAMERARNEPIAIIGAGCRFPGGASGVEAFWSLLQNGIDGICEVPGSRWNIDEFYSSDPDQPGRMATRWGGFIDDVEGFDAPFFELSPRMVLNMDPQQRLLLEVSWEALEHAGLPPNEWAGKPVGVYVGISSVDFAHLLGGHDEIDAYTGIGVAFSIAANRISYFYDFRGPSVAVDTACSSSLVSAHMAIQSLRSGESDLALAGGVNLMLSPAVTIHMSRARFMAPDGRCKTFDAGANGFVRGEGCGLVVLRRLSDALAAGDRILAVIRGSAVNQDGRSAGLTAPNVLAQQAVIRSAVKQAAIRPEQVTLIEAHGTGTSLGDPIEVEALQEVYGRKEDGLPCFIGSVKTNFGHLEAAAGVAGLLKAALALDRRTIPPHLNFKSLNPAITLAGSNMHIPLDAQEWRCPEGVPRLCTVSSFGVGGTNAHLILEEAPTQQPRAAVNESTAPTEWILPVSARTPEALRSLVGTYRNQMEQSGPAAFGDICYSAAVRRTHHPYRVGFAATSSSLLDAMRAFEDGRPSPAYTEGRAAADRQPVFLYSGMGAQARSAGVELMTREPAFRRSMEESAAALSRIASWSLLEELSAPSERSRLHHPQFGQPVQFAIQVALTALWRSWGVTPSAVVGHSMGEVAAAHACGALTLDDAMLVVYHRSRLMDPLDGAGRMAAVPLARPRVEELLADTDGSVVISAVNSPVSVIVSGAKDQVTRFVDGLIAKGIGCRYLQVETPYHSPLVAPYQGELRAALRGIVPVPAKIPMISTVTGSYVQGDDLDGHYWARNMRDPVLFAPAVESLGRSGHSLFLEIGSHPVLARPAAECLEMAGLPCDIVASLRRGEPERLALLRSAARLYTRAVPLAWSALYPQDSRFVTVPSYPWQRQHFPLPNRVQPVAAPSTPAVQEQPRRTLDRNGVYELLASVLASALGVSKVDPDANLTDAGLDSIALLECLSKLEQSLAVKIPLSALRTDELSLNALSARLWIHITGAATSEQSAVSESRIECLSAGRGPTVLLLPPIAAVAPVWQWQIDELASDHRVIVPNYPGYGDSTGPLHQVTIPGLAAQIARALEQLQTDGPVHLVGWSIGGMIAQQFALHYPDRTASLMLVNTTSRIGIENSFTSALALLEGLSRDFEENFPPRLLHQKALYEELLRAGTSSASPAVHLQYADLALQYDAGTSLSALRTPTTIVSGARDLLTPPAHGHILQQSIAGSTYLEISGAGHYVPLIAHEEFNAILRRFWSALTPAYAHSQGGA